MNKSDNSKNPRRHVCRWLLYLSLFKAKDKAPTTAAFKAIRLRALPSDWDTVAAACKQGMEGAKTFRNVSSTSALLSCDP